MKTAEQELADRRAAATPRDWPEDFDKETCWNTCERCLHYFIGIQKRIQCRECATRHTLEDLK